MDFRQKQSAYLGKQIVEINTNTDEYVAFEEKMSKATFRELIEIFNHFPDKYLDMTMEEFMELTLKDKEESEEIFREMVNSMSKEEIDILDALLTDLFSD